MSLIGIEPGPGESRYGAIARVLEQEIRSQDLAGKPLPSEQQLADRFGVNRHTLRRAIDVLIDSGLVSRQHGRGLFALSKSVVYPLKRATCFSANMETIGQQQDSRVISKQVIAASGGVARRLAIPDGSPVHWLEILRIGNSIPLVVSSHFLPVARFPDLATRFEGGSLHGLLREFYHVEVVRQTSVITASRPLGDDARLLAMPERNSVLRVKSVNLIAGTNDVAEYVLSRFRSDAIELHVQF